MESDYRNDFILLGPPKPGQVLIMDGRISALDKNMINNWPDEWAGTVVKFIIPPKGKTIFDCIGLVDG